MLDPFRRYSIREMTPFVCPICDAFDIALECIYDADARAKIMHERHAHRREHFLDWMAQPEAQPILDYCHEN